MTIIGTALYWVLQFYIYAMFGRFIVDLVVSVKPGWRPPAAVMPIIDFAYSITDPPIKFVRRFVPPLRLGPIALDLAWTIVLLAAVILQGFARGI
jgi:YggT family protein